MSEASRGSDDDDDDLWQRAGYDGGEIIWQMVIVDWCRLSGSEGEWKSRVTQFNLGRQKLDAGFIVMSRELH